MQEEQADQLFKINRAIKINLNIKSEVQENGVWKPLESNVFFNKDPEFCKFIIDTVLTQKNGIRVSDLPENYFNFLVKTGILIKEPPKPSGHDFKCLISDKIDSLVPYKIDISQVKENIENYRINPQIFIQENEEIPFQIRERIPFSDFTSSNYPILWIEAPKTKMIMPYWFNSEKAGLVYGLINGNLEIKDLTDPLIEQLLMANILVPKYYLTENFNKDLEEIFKKVKQILISNGYVILKDIINPLQIGALRKYLRSLEKINCFTRDIYLWERDLLHDEPVSMFIHHQLNYYVNKFTPEKIKPTYCGLTVYRPGAVLIKHKDEKLQDFNMSLSLDMGPENNTTEPWPFYLEVEGIIHEIKLDMGDAVIYRGSELPHWRNKLPENQKQTVGLFHFVKDNVSGS